MLSFIKSFASFTAESANKDSADKWNLFGATLILIALTSTVWTPNFPHTLSILFAIVGFIPILIICIGKRLVGVALMMLIILHIIISIIILSLIYAFFSAIFQFELLSICAFWLYWSFNLGRKFSKEILNFFTNLHSYQKWLYGLFTITIIAVPFSIQTIGNIPTIILFTLVTVIYLITEFFRQLEKAINNW